MFELNLYLMLCFRDRRCKKSWETMA